MKGTHAYHNEIPDTAAKGKTGNKNRPLDKSQGDMEPDMSIAPDVEVAPAGKVDVSPKIVFTKEDLDMLFTGTGLELTEEFSSKALTLFEGAVNAKVDTLRESITAELTEAAEAAAEQYHTFLEERLDTYLDLVVEEYITKNEVALERGIRNQFAEQVVGAVNTVVESFGITLDETQLEVSESITNELAETQTKLNESLETQADLRKRIHALELQEAFNAEVSDLTDVDREKVAKLAEGITYTDVQDYKSRVAVLKESLGSKTKDESVRDQLTEQVTLTEQAADKPELSDWQKRILVAARGEI